MLRNQIPRQGEPEALATPTERRLAGIWRDVLNVGRVARHDDFFALGGHSLSTIVVLCEIERTFGCKLMLHELLNASTLVEQAGLIDGRTAITRRQIEDPQSVSRPLGSLIAADVSAPSRPVAAPDSFPLSYGEESTWLLNQLAPQSALYNEPFAISLIGTLDSGRLQRALQTLIDRHESLRSAYPYRSGRPTRVVLPPQGVAFRLPVVDMTSGADADRQQELKERLDSAARRSFDLAQAPLFRATLFRLSDRQYALLFVFHHIICDEWSIRMLLRELADLYVQNRDGHAQPSESGFRYSDFARDQRNSPRSSRWERELTFWRDALADAPAEVRLPVDRARASHLAHAGDVRRFEIPGPIAVRLRDLGREENATMFTTLLAAFSVWLHRACRQDDFVIGTPIAQRMRPELQDVSGLLLNMLPLRMDLSGEPTFRELLRRTRSVTLDAIEHAEVPFELIVEDLQPSSTPGRPPLFNVSFVFLEESVTRWNLPGIVTEPLDVSTGTTKFDLTLYIQGAGEDLQCDVEFDTDLFEAATIERMIEQLRTLMTAIAAAADRPCWQLEFLTDAEREAVLVSFNQTSADYPRDLCLHEVFEEQVQKTPEAIALVTDDHELTYRQLNQQANRLAHELRDTGVRPGMAVAIAAPRCIEFVIGVLGILKTGGAYVPLDPDYPAERLRHMVQDTDAACLLTSDGFLPSWEACEIPRISLRVDPDGIGHGPTAENLRIPCSARDCAYIMYTSGSTGGPKGVMVPHRGVTRLVFGNDYAPFGSDERFLMLSTTSFDASTFELWGTLLHGSACVIFPEPPLAVDLLQQAIERHRISCLLLTTTLFHVIVDLRPELLRGVRHVLVGGEALSVPHARRALDRLPGTVITNAYGPTEGATIACAYRIPNDFPLHARSVPIGRPIANTKVYILDDHLQPLPIGVPGRLFVGGDGLAIGYLNQPDLTAERFISNPFDVPGSLLYDTGDLCCWRADGTVEYLDRLDEQVKIRGFRVELGEIEAALLRHPDVRQVTVGTRQEAYESKALVAYVVSDAEPAPDAAAFRNHLRQILPDPMIPTSFLLLDALPLTSTGKVDRAALPSPAAADASLTQWRTAPRTPTEQALAVIWRELLGTANVSIDDSFFDSGGTSLLAVEFCVRVEAEMGQRLPVGRFYDGPTIKRIAAALQHGDPAADSVTNSGDPGAAAGPPLFLLPDVSRTAFSLRTLAECLGTSPRCHFLDVPPVDAGANRCEEFRRLATQCVHEILDVQAEGPHRLAGFSFGGLLAFEVASQLCDLGHEDSLLFLLDIEAPNGDGQSSSRLRRTVELAQGVFRMPVRQQAQYLKRIVRRLARGRNGRPPWWRPSYLPWEFVAGVMQSYEARPHPVRIVLFCPWGEDLIVRRQATIRGWSTLGRNGFDCVTLPVDDHMKLLARPAIGKIAARIQETVAREDLTSSLPSPH